MGHLNQEHKNLRSTKIVLPTQFNESFPVKNKIKTKNVFLQCFKMQESELCIPTQRKLYSDQTGKFPYQSTRENNYIMVMYDYDLNGIMVEPYKTKKGNELASTLKKLCKKFKINKNEMNLFILDNER